MTNFEVKINALEKKSNDITNIAKKLQEYKNAVEIIKNNSVINGAAAQSINAALNKEINHLYEEAKNMKKYASILDTIAKQYKKTENSMLHGQSTKGKKKIDVPWIEDFRKKIEAEEEEARLKEELRKLLEDKRFSEEAWNKASLSDKIKILQEYFKEVSKIYGLEDVKFRWTYDDNKDSILYGYYNSDGMFVNIGLLFDPKNSYEMLDTINHEMRHAYQDDAIKNPDKYHVTEETIKQWKWENENYVDPDEDYKGYLNQDIEKDAYDFEFHDEDACGYDH